MKTGVFQANGVKRIGIAGHPEGNPDITKIHGEAMLLKALQEKQAYLKANGLEGFIATQFLFEAGPSPNGRGGCAPRASTCRSMWAFRGRPPSRRW